MTKRAFSFIGAGIFVYFLASQTQIGWLYLFDAIIWSLLVLSALINWYSLGSLEVERQVLLPTTALHRSQLDGPLEDEAIEVKLKVTNKGWLVRYFIKVLEDCPFDQPEKHRRVFLLNRLKPRSTTNFYYEATCYQRGYYGSSNITLESSDPLGLMVRRRIFPLPLNLTVYPAYYQLEGLPAADIAGADWGRAVKSSTANEFYGSKEYQHGDPLKHIHWRNTARVGNFMLKEFEQASQGSVTVAFKTNPNYGTGRETTLEYSIKLAASLAKLGTDSGFGIDIIADEKHLHNAGWRESMDFLAHLEAGEAAFMELTRVPEPGQIVVAIVPTVERELIPVLLQLSNRAWRMVVVLLEGFAPNEIEEEFNSRLRGSKVDIINCSRGNLVEAIEKLGNSLSFATNLTASVG